MIFTIIDCFRELSIIYCRWIGFSVSKLTQFCENDYGTITQFTLRFVEI